MIIYYEKGGSRIGPKMIAELDPFELEKETLVWHKGQTEWKKAGELPQLSEYFTNSPPPLPNKNVLQLNEKYDDTYKKETYTIGIGVTLLLMPLFLTLIGAFDFETERAYVIGRSFFVIAGFVIRILVCIYIVNIAKRQNRNLTGWGILSFILPSIALIIIGFLRRLKIDGQPTYAELTANNRSAEEERNDNMKFEQTNNIIGLVAFSLLALGFIALIILFITE